MTFYTPTSHINIRKAASTPFVPLGAWRAEVVNVHDDATVDVIVPRMTGAEQVFTRVDVLGYGNTPMYAIGDKVYVAFIEGRCDDLLVLGPVRNALTPENITGIPGGGGVDAIVFSWPGETIPTSETGRAPMPRDGVTREIQFTFNDAGTTETTVDVLVNAEMIITVTIPAGLSSYTYEWQYALTDVDVVSMQVTSVGDGALGLLAELRYDSTVTVDGLVFSWPGSGLSLRETGYYPMPRVSTTLDIRFTLRTSGSTDTIVEVFVNGTLTETVNIPAGATAYTYPWVLPLGVGDVVSMQITTAGDGAADLVAQVRYD
jgi:hypothetical protein